MKAAKALILLAIVATAALGFGHLSTGKESPRAAAGLTEKDLSVEKARLERDIRTIGAKSAYAAFKEENRETAYDRQHALAHIFGELMYESEGIEGISVCDSSFGFGCFHSFFGKAIQEKGIRVVKELDGACIEAFGLRGTGCSHGIGHGVLSYTGEESLLEALEICSTLTFKGPIGGCSSGVFMEYNFRTMTTNGRSELRPLSEEQPYAPCDSLSLFRESCYFEAPSWWRASLEQRGHAPEETYRILGSWCISLSGDEYEACLRGVGNVIPANAAYDLDLSIERCGLMPDKESELWCRKGAAWGFFADPARREKAVLLCELGAREGEAEACLSDYQII